MEIKAKSRAERIAEASVALMIPALILLWWTVDKRPPPSWEEGVMLKSTTTLAALKPYIELVRWPIEQGWAWSLFILGVASVWRLVGYGKEALLVLGTQGAALLASAALVPLTRTYPPRLDVLVYTSFGLVCWVLMRRFLPRWVARVVTGLLAPVWVFVLLVLLAMGISPVVLALSVLLGIGSVVTLTVGMK